MHEAAHQKQKPIGIFWCPHEASPMLERLSEGAGKLTKTQLTRRQSRANEMKERRKKATEYQRGLPDLKMSSQSLPNLSLSVPLLCLVSLDSPAAAGIEEAKGLSSWVNLASYKGQKQIAIEAG